MMMLFGCCCGCGGGTRSPGGITTSTTYAHGGGGAGYLTWSPIAVVAGQTLKVNVGAGGAANVAGGVTTMTLNDVLVFNAAGGQHGGDSENGGSGSSSGGGSLQAQAGRSIGRSGGAGNGVYQRGVSPTSMGTTPFNTALTYANTYAALTSKTFSRTSATIANLGTAPSGWYSFAMDTFTLPSDIISTQTMTATVTWTFRTNNAVDGGEFKLQLRDNGVIWAEAYAHAHANPKTVSYDVPVIISANKAIATAVAVYWSGWFVSDTSYTVTFKYYAP
jgi:hypothetical protein